MTDREVAPRVLAWLVQEGLDGCDAVFADREGQYLHLRRSITDTLTDQVIGKVSYTLKKEDKALQILDLDITMDNEVTTALRFNRRRETSSDANEYYMVELAEAVGHLEIETVNRHTVEGELEGTVRDVSVSAFPFELSIYEDMDALNKSLGFDTPITNEHTGLTVSGYSDRFIMPGGTFRGGEESYSFVIGEVVSFRDVEIALGEVRLPFVLARVDTALGIIPVVMGREVFDIADIKNGCVVGMNADIKADLATDGDFKNANRG